MAGPACSAEPGSFRCLSVPGTKRRAPDWRALPVQYADYTVAARCSGRGRDPESAIVLCSFPVGQRDAEGACQYQIDLPSDRERPEVAAADRGERLSIEIDADTHAKLLELVFSEERGQPVHEGRCNGFIQRNTGCHRTGERREIKIHLGPPWAIPRCDYWSFAQHGQIDFCTVLHNISTVKD